MKKKQKKTIRCFLIPLSSVFDSKPLKVSKGDKLVSKVTDFVIDLKK